MGIENPETNGDANAYDRDDAFRLLLCERDHGREPELDAVLTMLAHAAERIEELEASEAECEAELDRRRGQAAELQEGVEERIADLERMVGTLLDHVRTCDSKWARRDALDAELVLEEPGPMLDLFGAPW